jgi:peroxiredoxin
LRAYQKILPEIEALGAFLVAISPQTPDNTLSTAEKNNLSFEVLSDRGNGVARRFGLVFRVGDPVRAVYGGRFGIDLARSNGDNSWELPIPGTFVIARDGTIRLAYVDVDYTTRLEPSDIVDCLRILSTEDT